MSSISGKIVMMDGIIQEIKNKVDIVDLISSYIPVKRMGRNFKANCPFHNEKTPSFVISPDRQIWHCFGTCHEGGDCIKFVMKWENITFYEALKELAVKYGIPMNNVSFQDKEWEKKEKIYQINNLAAEFFQHILLKTPFGAEAMDYLNTRHVSEGIIKTFQIGYSPNSWDSLLKLLHKKNFLDEDIIKSGIVVKSNSGHIYDRFRGRLMFPLKDIRGNVIGFSGRILNKKEDEAKYINSPETDVYHKRESLFGIHIAKEAIKKEDSVLLVEGEFDMISPYQFGIENVVAVKGSALTKDQLTILKRLTNKILFAFDADKAGGEAIKKAIQEAELMDFEMYVVDWEGDAKDPDEMVRNHLIEFKKKIKSPISIYDFVIDLSQKKYPGDTAFDKKKIGEEVGSFIASIKNPIIQSHYIKKLARILEVSEDSVSILIKQFQQKNAKPIQFLPKAMIEQPKQNRDEMFEKHLLSYMFQHDKTYEIADIIRSILDPKDFSILPYQKIFASFLDYKNTFPQDVKGFCDSLSPELQGACNELFLYNIESLQESIIKNKGEQSQVEKIALQIKKNSLKKSIFTILQQNTGEDQEKENLLAEMSATMKEVEKKINLLYNY